MQSAMLVRSAGRTGAGATAFGALRLPSSSHHHQQRQQHLAFHRPLLLPLRSFHLTPTRLHGGHGHHHPHLKKPGLSETAPDKELESGSAAPQEQTPKSLGQRAKFYWQKARGVLHHYTLGTKLLWKNAQRYRAIRKSLPPDSHGKSSDWVDASHLRRTRLDLSLGVPFVLVFALPVVGYLAPLFAVFAPRYIPSTFHTSAHVGTFLKEDARAGRQVLKRLLELYGFHGQACDLGKMRELIRRIERGHGQIDTLTDLVDLADIMHELTPNISRLPRAHLRQLHQSLTHSSFIAQRLYTSRMLARGLERWRDTIWEDDQLLERHGIERLTTAQVVEALYARGIYRHPLAMAFVLQQTQHRALQSVDAKTHQDDLTKPDLLLPPSPSRPTEAVRVHWRKTLHEWVQLHRMVHEGAAERRRTTTAADTSLTTPPIDTDASEAAVAKSSAPSTEQVRPVVASSSVSSSSDSSFPMAFIVHAPALARVPQTITPTDKPAPMPPPPTGEMPTQTEIHVAATARSTAA